MDNFTFIDLFSGIGGFRIAAERNGGTCLGFSEIATNAIKAYCENFNEDPQNNFGNIKKIKEIPHCDLLTAGVPCQSWSVAGKMRGFADERGQLWDDTLYLLKQSQPETFIFENVKGLADVRNKEALTYIMNAISEIGYYATPLLLDSADFGVPQSRVRLYIVGFKDFGMWMRFRMENPHIEPSLGSVLDGCEKTDSVRYHKNNGILSANENGFADYFMFKDLRGGDTVLHSWDLYEGVTRRQRDICRLMMQHRRRKEYGDKDGNPMSLEALQGLDPTIQEEELDAIIAKGIMKRVGEKYEFKHSRITTGIDGVMRIFMPTARAFATLTASDSPDYVTPVVVRGDTLEQYKKNFIEQVYRPHNYRKITKEEACRMQGFPQDFILPSTRAAWMKLIGNSVAIPVVEHIIKCICETGVYQKNSVAENGKSHQVDCLEQEQPL